jgi:protein-S-isoprenylcysteine O-methyltransferase Ste14
VRATALEFRFRYAIHLLIYLLGFFAPWNYALHLDPPGPISHVWGMLATNLTQLGVSSIVNPLQLLLGVAIFFALAGATLRTWGGAYLGADIVKSDSMHSAKDALANDGILTDGPFGYLRNPLYVGTFLHTLALVLLMQRSGALFTLVAIGFFQVRLMLGEEAFLSERLGTPYEAYCKLVPRILPALRRKVAAQGVKPRWAQALAGESYFWIVAGSFAIAGWQYNVTTLERCLLVAVGVSMVVRALLPSVKATT